jgi:triosephosphate isomerase
MKPPLVVGNWKMHGTASEASFLARRIRKGTKGIKKVDVVLAPPFTALAKVHEILKRSKIQLAGQNLHWQTEGAFTGEISPKMLSDSGCRFVIIGHSERRHLFHESDQDVARKIVASLQAGLVPILCVGETLQERTKGSTARVVTRQLRIALKGITKSAIQKIDIAYEPVWAIGTGHNATPDQVRRVHGLIRNFLRERFGKKPAGQTRILYGGSVRPDNAGELARVPDVNGLLVGGASLKPRDFLRIIGFFIPLR